jgi:hypothetical protein
VIRRGALFHGLLPVMTLLSFVELPPEICNLIYEYFIPDRPTKPKLTLQKSKCRDHELLRYYQSVSVVNGQIHAEFGPLFISKTTMFASLPNMPASS